MFLRAGTRRLTIEDVVRVRPSTLPGRYGVSFGVPFFTGKGSRHVVVTGRGTIDDEHSFTAILACDRQTRHCSRGRRLGSRDWFAIVTNPSRPLARG